jgi:hypothetical protein
MKNTQGKMVNRENAYEVWQSFDGSWTWYVLKKYQSPENEAKNEYARWFCDVTSPFVGEEGEMGDTYIKDIKSNARRIK